MTGIHIAHRFGEGLITCARVLAIARTRPSWVSGSIQNPALRESAGVSAGLVISIGLAVFVAPFACRGRTAWKGSRQSWALSIRQREDSAGTLTDYALPGWQSRLPLARPVAGAAGALVVLASRYC